MTAQTGISERFKALNVCVLIPTYNNAATIHSVVRDVLLHTDRVIVVNDGSTDNTLDLLKQLEGITIVTYPTNRGKGWALRQGFDKANELGFRHAISIDSDGQHFAADLHVFLDHLELHPDAIIIGARNMDQASVPGKSSFGNKFSNFWFWVVTGVRMPDTQSGYRLYPVHRLQGVRYYTRKYEFEIEVLARASWNGITVTAAPVKVFYPKKEERITHFRPFRDFSRITVLNTFLVLIALFYIKPRDLFRRVKKKIPGSYSANFFLTRRNQTREKLSP